ncbi:MAG TPA: ADP compounds hydrolase NudE [Gammaproteobacteria bacterium]
MKKPPQLIAKKTLVKTRVFTIEQLQLQFENGVEVEYERIVSSSAGAVLIVPQLDSETIILIREYCAGTQRYEIAFPKGRVEKGESLLASANREMMEEIGFGARQLEHVKSMTVSPGYMSHQTHIVYATDLYLQKLDGDEPEPIEVLYWNLNKLDDLIRNEEFTEARSIAALYLLENRLFSGK